MTTIAVFATAGAMALTGCSSSGKSTGGGLGGGSSTPATGGSSTGSAPAATGKTYTIGFEGPLSGANAQLGINELYGAQIAVDDANKDSSLGFKVKLIQSDDEGDPAKSPAAATALVSNPDVIAEVGPSFSGSTLAVGKIYSAANMAFVTPSASKGTLQTQGFKTFFRVIPNDFVEAPAGADFLKRHGTKNMFVLQDLSPYGQGVGDSVKAQAQKDGIKVTEQGLDGTTTKNYGPIAQTIANSGADTLFYAGYDAQAALLAKALVAAGFKGTTIGGNGIKSSVFTKDSGSAGNGWYMTCGCADATTLPAAKQFVTEYQAKYHTPPSTYSPEAYDATNLVIAAIKAAGANPTRQSVAEQVAKSDFKGLTATIKFQSNGDLDPAGQVVNLYRQVNGVIKVLGTNIKTQS
ncbi:MAG TPA: branched-chain amino acid ABC transporter substrate-binding protein [Jatrophihabitans sp.]|jgi:branched-chain amino acid transport system substrate-binding protein|uniref:branched-chain amino acid ABC transporter substrate-binding protein n=1 Tax=Jatrophihabitans sp. TaxID=1932789 RepID=UPI002E06B48A|nr:branched-chain amino acid ABC transporter substrate-binding protein [Jatrophihabitans sp.]